MAPMTVDDIPDEAGVPAEDRAGRRYQPRPHRWPFTAVHDFSRRREDEKEVRLVTPDQVRRDTERNGQQFARDD